MIHDCPVGYNQYNWRIAIAISICNNLQATSNFMINLNLRAELASVIDHSQQHDAPQHDAPLEIEGIVANVIKPLSYPPLPLPHPQIPRSPTLPPSARLLLRPPSPESVPTHTATSPALVNRSLHRKWCRAAALPLAWPWLSTQRHRAAPCQPQHPH